MRKVLAILLISIFSLSATVRADEGMWLLSLIGKNYEQMRLRASALHPKTSIISIVAASKMLS